MTLILFPLRSEYTVATHTAVLSLLASMCDGVPRFAGHTSTHARAHAHALMPIHFQRLPPTPHGISELSEWPDRPSWSTLLIPHLRSAKFQRTRARHHLRTTHGHCTISCTETVGAAYLRHHQVSHFSLSSAYPSPRSRLTHVARQSIRERPTCTSNLVFQ